MFQLVAFPDNLTRLRQQRGLTQQALANAAGIHVTQLRRYEASRVQWRAGSPESGCSWGLLCER